ncbi:hypothetical protein R3P38DRAFT_2935332 [Favolaschia claudopus]|uniref:Uncharacterized protein n=1 Tax=Favolaschia claudopus TaxID=2862362 RepID=A0AAW0BND9_9AGAR
MAKTTGFPWDVFTANTLRPMMSDVLRAGGYPPSNRLTKEESLELLKNIEKTGLAAALKQIMKTETSSTKAKRKQPDEEEDESASQPNGADVGESSSRPQRKRGRQPRAQQPNDAETISSASRPQTRNANANANAESISAPPRTRAQTSTTVREGMRPRRQASSRPRATTGAASSTRSVQPAARPRKTVAAAPKKNSAGGSKTVSAPPVSSGAAKPTSQKFFDGIELMKRPPSYVGKGKGKEQEPGADADSDVDAEGEVDVDETVEPTAKPVPVDETQHNENEPTLTELANAETDNDAESDDVRITLSQSPKQSSPAPQITVERLEPMDAGLPKDPAVLLTEVEEIGSPAPQISIVATDDQIEAARLNHDVMSVDIGSPAPQITIEPMAEDEPQESMFNEPGNDFTIQFDDENGFNGFAEADGFLRARPPGIEIPRAGTPLNPEYNIEVFSPGSAQHDSDDEMWVANGINGTGLQAAGGGLEAMD